MDTINAHGGAVSHHLAHVLGICTQELKKDRITDEVFKNMESVAKPMYKQKICMMAREEYLAYLFVK